MTTQIPAPVEPATGSPSNPVTFKGALSLAVGLSVIAIPNLSLAVLTVAVGLALAASGASDIWSGLTRRAPGRRESRFLALLRGCAALAAGLLLLIAPQGTLAAVVRVLGIYLLVQGLASLLFGLFGKDRSRRVTRLTAGASGLALGVLASTSPEAVTGGTLFLLALALALMGAILLVQGIRLGRLGDRNLIAATTPELLWDWIRSGDVGGQRRGTLADTLYFEEPGLLAKLIAWWTMLLLSVSIATLAILQDSTAVVIGAMLVAPLMTPILGLAGAVVNGWTRRALSSATLVALGVAAAIAVAFVISSWIPDLTSFDSNSQITSRVSPTFIDMLIALAAGAAGAFATVNARVASSIAGVAIAVALVPPLGVVGVALQNQRLDDASGAFLLFLTNFVSIVLSAAVVFVLAGFADSANLRERFRSILSTLAPFGALALVVLVPLTFTAGGVVATANDQHVAQTVVDDWVDDSDRLRVERVDVAGSDIVVALTGSETLPPTTALQQALAEELGRPIGLRVEFTPSIEVAVTPDGQVTNLDPVTRPAP